MVFHFTFDNDEIYVSEKGEVEQGLSKKSKVFDILCPEVHKGIACNYELFSTLRQLDNLKQRCAIPFDTFWELKALDDDPKTYSRLTTKLVRLDVSYVMLRQFAILCELIDFEMEKLNKQLNIRFKMFAGEQLTQEEKLTYIPFEIEDLNELARFISLWDIGRAFKPRYDQLIVRNQFKNEFHEGIYFGKLMRSPELEGDDYEDDGNYAENFKYFYLVKAQYNRDLEKVKETCELINKHWEILEANINRLNELEDYTPTADYQYNDGIRSPIDCAWEREFIDEDYAKQLEKYNRECMAQKQAKCKGTDLGR